MGATFRSVNEAAPKWVASNRYWRKVGYVTLAVALVVPFFVADEEVGLAEGLAIAMGFTLPPVLWMRRLAAWEEDDVLVIRSWFATKRRPWSDIDGLRLIERNWGTSWVTAAVQRGDKRTYLNSMVAVSDAGVEQLIEELEVLAIRRGLSVDEPPEATFRQGDAGIGGFRPFD